ncbi:MAG: LysM peptidoglycan-binding domain-containing protein [Prevotella sp.]
MRAIRILAILFMAFVAHVLHAQQCEHIVQRGEDFESIASKYSITVEELMEANPESKLCYAGRKLLIPFAGKKVERKPVNAEPLDLNLRSSSDTVLTHSAATTYQVGYANWKKQKYDVAYYYLLSAAQQGETRAYYPLGDCYMQESLDQCNEQEAVMWFLKTINEVTDRTNNDYCMASLRLADCYANAKGTSKDIAEARYHYKQYSRHTKDKNNQLAAQILATIKSEEAALVKAESDKKMQVQRAKEEAYLADIRQRQTANAGSEGGQTTVLSTTTAVAVPQPDTSQQPTYSGAYTVETTGYWGHKQTLYVQAPMFLQGLEQSYPLELFFSSKSCSVIRVYINYSVQTHPAAVFNPLLANMCNLVSGWSVHTTFSKGYVPGAFGIKNYTYDNNYFRFQDSSGIIYWLAQDLSSFVIASKIMGAVKYEYRISKEQYEQLSQIEQDFLGKVDAFEAKCYTRGSSSSTSSELTRSLKESIEECDRNIDAINRKSVDRYTNPDNYRTNVKGIYYAPDYTGGQYIYRCPECGKWGPNHVHYNLNK